MGNSSCTLLISLTTLTNTITDDVLHISQALNLHKKGIEDLVYYLWMTKEEDKKQVNIFYWNFENIYIFFRIYVTS